MSDSGSDRSRRRRHRRKSPYVAFYGPRYMGPPNSPGYYHDGADPDWLRDDDDRVKREASPSPRRCSWIVEAMERLASELSKSGFEPKKASSKVESKKKKSGDEGHDYDKAAIEDIVHKLVKLESAMRCVQDTLQGGLERLKKAMEKGEGEKRGGRSPLWREERYRSPPPYFYRGWDL